MVARSLDKMLAHDGVAEPDCARTQKECDKSNVLGHGFGPRDQRLGLKHCSGFTRQIEIRRTRAAVVCSRAFQAVSFRWRRGARARRSWAPTPYQCLSRTRRG